MNLQHRKKKTQYIKINLSVKQAFIFFFQAITFIHPLSPFLELECMPGLKNNIGFRISLIL